MNALTNQPESAALAAAAPSFALAELDAATLMLGPMWERVQAVGKMMARGGVTIPQHLRGNEADCCAVALQAFGWRMNPFAVAQKTHVSQGGALGYEAQLVNAVIQQSGALAGDPDYSYIGDWNKVLGKVEERKSDKGGKYYVAAYTRADEEGLGIIVRATLRGESKPRELTVLMSQAWPRFSTQWATDPKQQIAYLALRKFVRLHKPGVILGVYSNDEMEPPAERFMGPAEVVEPKTYPQDQFEKNLPAWRKAIAGGKKTADDVIATIETKAPLTDEQKAQIRAAVPAQDVQPKEAAKAPAKETFAEFEAVAKQIAAAQDHDQLAVAGSLIASVANEKDRTELTRLYDERGEQLAF